MSQNWPPRPRLGDLPPAEATAQKPNFNRAHVLAHLEAHPDSLLANVFTAAISGLCANHHYIRGPNAIIDDALDIAAAALAKANPEGPDA